MENHNWAAIKGSASAPYINGTLLKIGAHAEQYYNPPGVHPSEPNYLWLEAGQDFGVTDDRPPASNHQTTHNHLARLLEAAGVSWRVYAEDISGMACPLSPEGTYVPQHNPVVFFDDVTNNGSPQAPDCLAHVRPYGQMAADLRANATARYSLIIPNTCDDMHDAEGCATRDGIANGDRWLAGQLPPILASMPYRNGGLVLIVWDEAESGDGPIGLIALSPSIRPGYASTLHYTHSSTLRTVEEIFGLQPLLGDAARATDLSDMMASTAGG